VSVLLTDVCIVVLAEIESCQARNRSYPEMKELVNAQIKKYLPLSATTAGGIKGGVDLEAERMKDLVSHFVLRLAFCRT
jgi:DNA primase large subunit